MPQRTICPHMDARYVRHDALAFSPVAEIRLTISDGLAACQVFQKPRSYRQPLNRHECALSKG